jgi:hypothetical protein
MNGKTELMVPQLQPAYAALLKANELLSGEADELRSAMATAALRVLIQTAQRMIDAKGN